jgi:hypothetical protein
MLQQILESIKCRYGSMNEPDFHWVQSELAQRSFGTLISRLAAEFDMRDITDPNTDVSRALELAPRATSKEIVTLRLSLVGPYACIARHRPTTLDQTLMDGATDAQNPSELLLVSLLESEGIALLDRRTLAAPVPLMLFETDPDRVRVYQALFSDVDFLPGEFKGE